ncbi:MAG: hypothetical protein IV100_26650 [Myxococcales bacterium]|nr:hypothetical protein [Myxococcales bacterium]
MRRPSSSQRPKLWCAAVVVVALAFAASGCESPATDAGVDVATDIDASSGDASVCVGPGCEDVPGPPCETGVLLPGTDRCVQCVTDGDCQGGVCHPQRNQCVSCYLDSHCGIGVCDPERSFCVECLADADCGSGDCDEAKAVCRGCGSDADCDDENPCTVDTCGAKVCSNTVVDDGEPCDRDPCLDGETCAEGACVGGERRAACDACSTSDMCPAGLQCEKPAGACDGLGRCATPPGDCLVDETVCGCDGLEYPGACFAHAAGTSVSGSGLCPCFDGPLPCGPDRGVDTDGNGCLDHCFCSADVPCTSGTYCDAACGQSGTCAPVEPCDEASGLVCACDGQTYETDCAAKKSGLAVAAPGACCVPVSCTAGGEAVDADGDGCPERCACTTTADCLPGERCAAEGCDAPGLCEPCAAAGPVCGCDGQTYESACAAPRVASVGPCCAPMPDGCDVPVDTDQDGCPDACQCPTGSCPTGQHCAPTSCDGGPSLCRACPDQKGVVCGCGGTTYASACAALEAGVAVLHAGACACDDHAACGEGQFCATAGCGDAPGACLPCEAGAVCGCDGKTWPSACAARDAGVRIGGDGSCCVSPSCAPGSVLVDQDGDGCPETCVALPCATESPCPQGAYCERPVGGCATKGVCQPAESTCESLLVCGCDGVQYASRCAAAKAGTSLARVGACCKPLACELPAVPVDSNGDGCPDLCKVACAPPTCLSGKAAVDVDGDGCPESCPCTVLSQCGSSEFCERAAGACLGSGYCRPRPLDCTAASGGAVCGCNGATYPNLCVAEQAGATVASVGACCKVPTCAPGSGPVDTTGDGCPDACKPLECTVDSECGNAGFYCERPKGTCGGKGLCAERPLSCDGVVAAPVCGCDGASYGNPCLASAAGVSLKAIDACKCKPVCAVGYVALDADGDGCAEGCVPACKTDCDCQAATGGAPPLTCGCVDCKANWTCQQGACKATCDVLPAADCATGGSCLQTADCPAAAFCNKPAGQCAVKGTCTERPTTCGAGTAGKAPVCGCEGKSYPSACDAALAGSSVAALGACP